MENFDAVLRNKLRQEALEKGRAPAVTFLVFAVYIMWFGFGCVEYVVLIKSAALLSSVLVSYRMVVMLRFKKVPVLTQGQWNLFRCLVWSNCVCWSVIFTLTAYELKFSGLSYVFMTFICIGFVSSSLITLSGDLTLFIPFQLLILGPQIILLVSDALTDQRFGSTELAPIFVIYLGYQLWQVKDFRRKIIDNYKFQLDLERSDAELRRSQATQVEQTSKLIHTSRLAALGEMAAGIAHEVNNPLAIISGSLEQLERRIHRLDLTDLKDLLKHTERSQQSIQRITKIITGLRLFSQQSDVLPKTKVTLQSIIDDTLNFCSEMLKARFVQLQLDSVPDVLVSCHPVQISQVLINLLKNAEDALPTTGEERWIRLSFELASQTVAVRVINGGEKIPVEHRDRLFQPFFTTKGVGKGTGLGLSISRGIMHEHGGELYLEERAASTTFTVVVPILPS